MAFVQSQRIEIQKGDHISYLVYNSITSFRYLFCELKQSTRISSAQQFFPRHIPSRFMVHARIYGRSTDSSVRQRTNSDGGFPGCRAALWRVTAKVFLFFASVFLVFSFFFTYGTICTLYVLNRVSWLVLSLLSLSLNREYRMRRGIL
jgi:hypothetical protein